MNLFASLGLFITCSLAQAYGSETQRPPLFVNESSKPALKGEYRVTEIKRLDRGGFEVVFTATNPTNPFNQLRLVTANIHIGLKSNQVLRLAAEYIGSPQKNVEISQVLLYLPGDGTNQVPVWLMSSEAPQNGLTASKYIDMHAPSMDFQVY